MFKSYPHLSWKSEAKTAACALLVIGAAGHLTLARAAEPGSQATTVQALNEIVVTAQKVKQRLQDVPITVTALSRSALAEANVTTMADLPRLVSGLVWSNEGAWALPSIRGVSSNDASDGAASPVAIYVDGVYQPDSSGTLADLPDISSIQVLKGPQGTLYGQNAVAGAIVVNTLGPSFTPSGHVEVNSGLFGGGTSRNSAQYGASAFATGPLLGHTLAGSISAYYSHTDGYLTNDQNDQRAGRIGAQNVRGKLLWTPTDDISVLATAYYIHREDGTAMASFPYDGQSVVGLYPDGIVPKQPWHIAYTELPPNFASNNRGASLKATFDLGLGTLTSLTGYTNNRALVSGSSASGSSLECVAYFACAEFRISEPDETWTQEFDFASHRIGRFRFLGGLYGFRDNAIAYIPYNHNTFITDTKIRTVSYSAYAEGTYYATSKLSVTAGARVTHDAIRAWGYIYPSATMATQQDEPYADKGWTAATPRASLVYKINSTVNTYFTFSEGFLGGVASGEYALAPPASPEKLYAYELGLKAARSRYRLDLSAFYYDYKDLQVETLVNNGTVTEPQNAANAKIYGLDFDGAIRWNDAFETRLNTEYLAHATYESFPDAITYKPPLEFPYGFQTDNYYDASGTRMLAAPVWTGSLSGTYTKIFAPGVLKATASLSFSSAYRWVYTGSVQTSGYYTLNAQLSYSPASSNFRYTLFGTNLTNKEYIDGLTSIQAAAEAFYAPPREVGVKIDYSW